MLTLGLAAATVSQIDSGSVFAAAVEDSKSGLRDRVLAVVEPPVWVSARRPAWWAAIRPVGEDSIRWDVQSTEKVTRGTMM